MKARALVSIFALVVVTALAGQEAPKSGLPTLVRFSGVLQGLARGESVPITFSLYSQRVGGEALWSETQIAMGDEHGRYSVLLGATSPNGLPPSLFTTGEARWLGVRVAREGESEEQRVALVSVPYALAAADAKSFDGRPVSDFVLTRTAEKFSKHSSSGNDAAYPEEYATSGTAGRIAKFINSTDLGNSVMAESGGYVGLNSTSPRVPLDVFGNNTSVVLWVTQTNTSGYGMLVQTANDDNYALNIQNSANTVNRHVFWGNGNVWLANGAGNVGIGTTSPTSKLQVNGNLLLTGQTTHQVTLSGTATSGRVGQDASGVFVASDTNGADLRFFTNNGILNEVLRVTSSGNVGLGTPSPATKLHIHGNVLLTGNPASTLQVNGTTTTSALNANNADLGTVSVGNLSAGSISVGSLSIGGGTPVVFGGTTPVNVSPGTLQPSACFTSPLFSVSGLNSNSLIISSPADNSSPQLWLLEFHPQTSIGSPSFIYYTVCNPTPITQPYTPRLYNVGWTK